ncbi:MAG: NAD(P)H-dependent oxidoreductase [Bacteroidota bacterium]
MTKKIIAVGASNSKRSINKRFAQFTANQLLNVEVTVLDLNDFDLPMYSIDFEKEFGIPKGVKDFSEIIKNSDAIVISVAEYNGLHTAAFKSFWEWLSRIPRDKPLNIWADKAMFLLSVTTSRRADSHVLKLSKEMFPMFGAKIISTFFLPSFNHFFRQDQITEPAYLQDFKTQLDKFQTHLNNQ